MILWRISNHPSLDGKGGLKWPGRWHTAGQPVVYCASAPAAALLEMLVRLQSPLSEFPVPYRLLQISAAESVSREAVGELPRDWMDDVQQTRAIGDEWLRSGRSVFLSVPSAVVPYTSNVMLNPLHPDAAAVTILGTSEHVVDARLVR